MARTTKRNITIGERFGMWLVINNGSNQHKFLCRCDCGTERQVYMYSLLEKNIRKRSSSCGCKPRPHKQKDITGLIVGKLTAVKSLGRNQNNQILWECKCECGGKVILPATKLMWRHQKSCGCNQHPSQLPLGESAFNIVYNRYKHLSKKKNRDFFLTKEQFYELTQQQCNYCGSNPIKLYNKSRVTNGYFKGNGIDRVVNENGYTIENSVSCCETCNRAKRAMTVSEFKKWIESVYSHMKASEENKLVAV